MTRSIWIRRGKAGDGLLEKLKVELADTADTCQIILRNLFYGIEEHQ